MFGMQLTLFQKLEVAFVCVVLGIAGVVFFWNSRPTFDDSISSTRLKVIHHPTNEWTTGPGIPSAVISATNPADPRKDEQRTEFACADGRLNICEYPNDPSRHLTFYWQPEDRQKITYHYYQDPFAGVDAIKDPFQRAITYATYMSIFKQKPMGLLGHVGLEPQQLTDENKARELMTNETNDIDKQVKDGTYHSDLFKALVNAFTAYTGKSGDPLKDADKKAAAVKVLTAAGDFDKQVHADKIKAIDKYIAAITGILRPEQKDLLVEAYRDATQPAPQIPGQPNGARRGAGNPTPGGAITPGGATGTPGRGTVTPGGATGTPARGGTRAGRGTTATAPGN